MRQLALIGVCILCSGLQGTAAAEGGYPRLLGRLGNGTPTRVVVQDGFAYCAMRDSGPYDNPGPFVVMELSDLAQPAIVGECALYPYQPDELVVSGSRAEGCSIRKIADRLGVAPTTVQRWRRAAAAQEAGG